MTFKSPTVTTWHEARSEEFSMALQSHHHRPLYWPRSPHLALHFPCTKGWRHDSYSSTGQIGTCKTMTQAGVQSRLRNCMTLEARQCIPKTNKATSRLLFWQTHLALWCMIWMYHDVSHQASIKTASYNRGPWLICQIPSLQWSRDPSFAQHVLGDTSLPDCFILAAKKTHCTRKS